MNAPGRDPIVTRILWLRGLERRNANAFSRMIYIHGTPEESFRLYSYLTTFIEKISKMNGGRAFFTTNETLGDYVLVDFVEQRRKLLKGA